MFLLAEVLLVEVLLAGVLLFGFLLVVEEETVLVVSGLLEEKGMILLGSEILGEEKALLFSGALLVIWYSWNLFSSGLCRCTGVLIQQREVYKYKCNKYKNGIGMSKII